MYVTMQSSHLLSDVLGVEVFFLEPTTSDDVAGARFCSSLPPSPPPFLGNPSLLPFLETISHKKTRWSRVGTPKIILDLYHVICLVR
jgi:hypothetical protein